MSKFDIPESWAITPLDNVCDLITCGTAARPEYTTTGIPFLSAKNVQDEKVLWSNYQFISEKTHRELTKNNKPKIGDILYTRVGSYGEAAIVDRDVEFSVFVSLTLIKPSTSLIINTFLKHYLNSESVKRLAKKSITGVGVGNLNVGAVRTFPAPIPPLSEQKRIVSKIASTQEKLKTIEQSVTKAEELIGNFALSFLKLQIESETTIGDSYEERIERFGRAASGTTSMVGVSNETGVMPLRSEMKVNKEKYKWVYRGDVFYNPMRLNVGSVALYMGETPAITSPDYVVVKPKDYSSGWLLFSFLKSAGGRAEIAKRTKGSVRERVYFSNMASIPFYRVSELDAAIINKCTDRVAHLKELVAAIRPVCGLISNSILQKAFTGKLVAQDPAEGTGHKLLQTIRSEAAACDIQSDVKPKAKSKKRVKV